MRSTMDPKKTEYGLRDIIMLGVNKLACKILSRKINQQVIYKTTCYNC